MSSADITPVLTSGQIKSEVKALFTRKRLIGFGVPILILAYFVYIFFSFDLMGIAQRAKPDAGATLVSDAFSYKTLVTRDNRTGEVVASIEGERKGTWPQGEGPDWVQYTPDGRTLIDLTNGYQVVYQGKTVSFTIPGWGVLQATPSRSGIETNLGDTPPDWINASRNRITVVTDAGRLTITRNKTEVARYFLGWELFFFTLDSPFYGKSFTELVGLVFSPPIVEGKSNLAAMAHDFWNNTMWRHGEVAWAIFETILMAFLGTFGAALVAFPLAFLAAKNFAPLVALRFFVRRIFDFVRGVDGLIWTIILSRAFGPGPLTGALAILLTDTGTFGKMFSEALENVDPKQIEGVQSTGARPVLRYRFGVIPQITPVLLSQLLYYFESNTRSATIIGAITGGGIGLLLTQAIITTKDWEEVTYYIVLIVLMVMAMDWFSGWLRRKLISGDEGGH